MKFFRILFHLLASFIRILLFGWTTALRGIWRNLHDIFFRWWTRRQLPDRARKATDSRCVPINEPAFRHPDPLIYSQYDLMARGYAVTWDNPDIELRKGGTAVPPWAIDPSTDYEIVARIWNGAPDAVVVGLPVVFSYLSFGIGVKINPIGATSVPRLGVKGGPDHPAFASITWRTPSAPGHYCILAFLAPTDDTNYNNNLGQENVLVGKAASPANFLFQLGNRSSRDQRFRFEVDTYAIPLLSSCERERQQPLQPPKNLPLMDATRPTVPPVHDRKNYPLPVGWAVDIRPAEPRLAPDEEMTIAVEITPPPGFAGRLPVNVHAFDGQGLAGGVTLYVEVP